MTVLAHRDLFYSRAYYFAFLGGSGFILPFINLFFVDIGLTGKQIGLMGSITAVLGLMAAPFWLDGFRQSRRPRLLLQSSLILGAVAYVLLGWQAAFLPILMIAIVHTLVMSGVYPASDVLAVSTASAASQGYGSVRVWGSISWIISVLAAGWLIDQFGFQAGFLGTALAFILGAVMLFNISPVHFSAQPADGEIQTGLPTALRKLRQNPTLLGIAIAICAITFFNAGIVQFENVYLAQLGASTWIISVAGILSAVVEIPVMIVIDRVLRRSKPAFILLLSFGATIIFRLWVLAFPSIASIMIVRLIGGLTFASYSVGYIAYITNLTNSSERGTMLAIIGSTLAGIAGVAAGPVAGWIFDSLGTAPLYLMSAIGYGIAFLALTAVNIPGKQTLNSSESPNLIEG